MKTKLTVLAFLAVSISVQSGFAQPAALDTNSKHIHPNQILKSTDLQLTPSIYVNDAGSRYYNDKMLNVLFRGEVGSIVHNSTDATANRWYATLGNEDELLSLGGTFGTSKDKTKKLTHLLSLGASLKSANGFATIVKNGEMLSGINGNVKYTWVGRGIINYGHGNYGYMMETYRKKILKGKMDKEIAEYIKAGGEFDQWQQINELSDGTKLESKVGEKELEQLRKKYLEYYEKMAVTEVEVLKENKWYNYLWDHWVTIDGTFPVSEKNYTLSDSVETPVTNDVKYYAFKVSASYTSMWKFRNDMSVYLSGRAKVYNNNNIEMKQLEDESYRDMVLQSLTNVAVTDEKDVYVGKFDRFISVALEAEAIYFIKKWIGVSASVERTFGECATTNWKVGVPFCLRDKDDKPTVNFELQYKQLNNDRLLGIRVGLVLGKFVG